MNSRLHVEYLQLLIDTKFNDLDELFKYELFYEFHEIDRCSSSLSCSFI